MVTMDILRLIARPLLAAPFVVDGWSALRFPTTHVQRARSATSALERVGVDLDDDQLTLATRLAGGATVAAGLCLALGRFERPAAAVLAVSALPLACVNNPVWKAKTPESRDTMRSGLLKSLGLFGGLLIASTDRKGAPSLAWRRQARRDQRALIDDVRAKAWEDARASLSA